MARRSKARASGGETVTVDQLDAVFSALAHAARRQVLVVLHARGGGMTAGQIADRFKHSWPTTTRHLGVLQEAGLVQVEVKGRERIYRLEPAPVRAAAEWCGWAFEPSPSVMKDESWKELPYAAMRNVSRADEETGRGRGNRE